MTQACGMLPHEDGGVADHGKDDRVVAAAAVRNHDRITGSVVEITPQPLLDLLQDRCAKVGLVNTGQFPVGRDDLPGIVVQHDGCRRIVAGAIPEVEKQPHVQGGNPVIDGIVHAHRRRHQPEGIFRARDRCLAYLIQIAIRKDPPEVDHGGTRPRLGFRKKIIRQRNTDVAHG